MAKKGAGKEAKLSFAGHVLMENRNGLAVNGCVTLAEGRAEVEAAVAMVEEILGPAPRYSGEGIALFTKLLDFGSSRW